MTVAVLPIPRLPAILAAALVTAGCATPGLESAPGLGYTSPCPDRTLFICVEPTKLNTVCGCASRSEFEQMMGMR